MYFDEIKLKSIRKYNICCMDAILISGIGGPTPRSIAKVIKQKYPKCVFVGEGV